jgi:hypothetical protein
MTTRQDGADVRVCFYPLSDAEPIKLQIWNAATAASQSRWNSYGLTAAMADELAEQLHAVASLARNAKP